MRPSDFRVKFHFIIIQEISTTDIRTNITECSDRVHIVFSQSRAPLSLFSTCNHQSFNKFKDVNAIELLLSRSCCPVSRYAVVSKLGFCDKFDGIIVVADWYSMGNKLVIRKRHQVDEKYTRPQGLYQHKDVDHKKLRKLILDSKLAPCYPGDDDCNCDLEECPICFLYYPSLNRSRCCMKVICTECFLQMKTPNSTRPTQCPFCKNFNYAVEYRGVKTKEEKGLEQIEEQRVIDAKIRMRRQEIKDEEERMKRRQDMISSSSGIIEGDEIVSIGGSGITNPSGSMHNNRNDEFDLENIMLMEAIWLSFQEGGSRHHNYGDERYPAELHVSAAVGPPAGTSSSSSYYGGLACKIAREEGSEIGAYGLQDESFEEQMMLAMAVSLSESRCR